MGSTDSNIASHRQDIDMEHTTVESDESRKNFPDVGMGDTDSPKMVPW